MSINVISINKILFWAIFSIKIQLTFSFFFLLQIFTIFPAWLVNVTLQICAYGCVGVRKAEVSVVMWLQHQSVALRVRNQRLRSPLWERRLWRKIYRDPEPPVGENKVLNLDSKDWTLKVSWSLFSVIFTALIWSWVLPEQNNLCFLLMVLQKYWAPELINKMDWIHPRRNGRPQPCRQQVDFNNC